MARRETPEMVPVLSRGKHRSPRKGACFMEYASFLAGERWSDHPRCTHPLLASVARGVNDHISDEARKDLVELIPSVVGLTGDDPRIDAAIAIRSAATALPVVSEQRQRALAAGLIAARRVFDELDAKERSPLQVSDLFDHAETALSRVPLATEWAKEFTEGTYLTSRALQRRSAPCIIRVAVVGIAEACVADSDRRLHELLASVVSDCTRWLRSNPDVTSDQRPDPVPAVL